MPCSPTTIPRCVEIRGSVMKRDDVWRARFYDRDGRERQKSFRTKGEATRFLNDQLSQLQAGSWVDPAAGAVTFARYAEMWRAAQHVRPGTANLHEQRVRLYLNPVLGTVPLRAIRRSHVVEVVRRCSHDLGLSPLVTRYAVTTLRAILTAAVADRLIPNNVAIDRTIQMPRPQRATGTLSAEHVAAIAARMEGRYRAMVTLGAASGLRPGELTGLTIDRCAGLAAALTDGGVIDLAARRAGEAPDTRLVTLKVDRQINSGKRQFGPPKTPSSVRDVTVGATVVAALVHHVRTTAWATTGCCSPTPRARCWARLTCRRRGPGRRPGSPCRRGRRGTTSDTTTPARCCQRGSTSPLWRPGWATPHRR